MTTPIEKIIFFKNQGTQYEVLHCFREALERAIQKRNVATSLIDFARLDRSAFFLSIYSNPPDYTLAFNGLQPLSNGTFLCDELEIPHIAWMVDSAHYFYDMVKTPLNILICPDEKSATILKSWGAKNVFFLPHAFDAKLTASPEIKKTIPLLFCGSLMDPQEIEEVWKKHLPESLAKDLMEAARATLEDLNLCYQDAFERVQAKHFDFFSKLTPHQIADFAMTVDRYLRAKDRINLLKGLKGLPVHIYGNSLSNKSWGDFLDLSEKNYHIHPAVNFVQAIELMKKAQIVLNSSPMFKTGAHERIFYGLGLGSAVLTNATPWNQDHFSKDELLTYSSKDPSQIKDQIEALLQCPKSLREIAEKGQKKVLKEHTWDVRASELIELLEKL